MIWSSVEPDIGGEVAARVAAIREEVYSGRVALAEEREGIPCVAEFYAGRNVFLTGGSGFLGRLIIEMLLRTCPDIGNVYLVVRSRKGVAPQERLQGLLDVPLFDRVRAERPGALDKIVVLPGDITSLGLGLSEEHEQLLRREVSVVFHLAASVRFDDPIQKAVFTNLRSTREVVELARGMPQLRSLVHVSTAYTNINREPLEECVYDPHTDWREVIRWAEELGNEKRTDIDFLGPKLLDFQPNTYTFTKALAEKVIDDVADELPVIITRPSIVVATFKDPIPGWIDNLYGFAGFWAGGFKGVLRVQHVKKDFHFDSIPADIATKTIVLSSWHRGLNRKIRSAKIDTDTSGAEVVNVTVGNHVGITHNDMSWVVSEEGCGRLVPYPGAVRPPSFTPIRCKYWFLLNFWYHHILFGFVLDTAAKMVGIRPRLLGVYRTVKVAMEATARFNKEFTFVLENQTILQIVMSPRDEKDFCYMEVLKCKDTVEDFRNLCANSVRGILEYTLKEEHNPEKNWKPIARLKWIMPIYHSVMASIFLSIVYVLFRFSSGNQFVASV